MIEAFAVFVVALLVVIIAVFFAAALPFTLPVIGILGVVWLLLNGYGVAILLLIALSCTVYAIVKGARQ